MRLELPEQAQESLEQVLQELVQLEPEQVRLALPLRKA
jgi:coproporphyrinogen III oxidase-like Fe-S oxidoreductase